MKIQEIDIKGGEMTFGQRIELGKIFTDKELSEIEKFEKTFECLHKQTPEPKDYSKLVKYFNDILIGLAFWVQQESILLKHNPTAKEIRAGVKDLSAKTGDFGTVKALAKNYNQDPDTILEWKYGKVFGILYTDLEEYKYQLRYSELK